MISLAGLNDKQREAANTVEGPLLILAGAGSGKTRTITYRMAHMISNCQISPKNILGVTFTNKAAKEMKERVHTLLGKNRSRGITLTTFHSLGVRVLKKEIEKLGYYKNFSIYDTSDQMAIIREALKQLNVGDKKFDKKLIQSKISFLKNNAISEDDFADSVYFNPDDAYDHATLFVYNFYQEKLKFYNSIDFDDILHLTVKLFKENPDVAKKYSQKYKYIMVDEYQDTNPLQFDLIKALTSTHDNLCVVGDDDQSIYAFRGADVKIILGFEQEFKNAKIVKLEENYRSVSPILNLANKVIKENKNRKDKTLWSKRNSEQLPILWAMADSDHESQIVVEEILNHQKAGNHLGDIAVLYRSNTQAPIIEEQLRMSNIPYTVIGGQKYYEKKEIKDIMAYLCTIINPKDELSLRRILNIPHRGIGKATLDKFLEKSKDLQISLFEAMENFDELAAARANHVKAFVELIRKFQTSFKDYTLAQGISTLLEEINYLKFVEKSYDNPKQFERRRKDIQFFIDSAERFTEYNGQFATLKNFIEKLMLQDSQDNLNDEEEDDDIRKNEVTLMTLHSSKGLEFNIVYLIGMEEELLPHKRTVQEGEDLSEERRLAYVGITRAKERLVMTYCKERNQYGKDAPRFKSRFINELKDYYLEQDRTTFGHLSVEEAKQYKSQFFQGLIDNLDE